MKRRYRWTPDGVVEDRPAESAFRWIEPSARDLDEMDRLIAEGRAALADVGVPERLLRDCGRTIDYVTNSRIAAENIFASIRESGGRTRIVRLR